MDRISDITQVKAHNRSLIVNAIKSIPNGTKHTVSRMTGLSIATCNTILNELSERNIIHQVITQAPSIGRPATTFAFNSDYYHIIILYATFEKEMNYLHYAVVNLLGEPLEEETLPFKDLKPQEIIAILDNLTFRFTNVKTISLGIPGYYIDNVITSSTIKILNGFDLVSEIEARYSKFVVIENNLNAIALGMYNEAVNTIDSLDTLVAISFFHNGGLGSGIIIDGKILKGNTNFAGEILHLPYGSGTLCNLVNGSEEDFLNIAVTAVQSFISIINPKAVVFIGELMSDSPIPTIIERVKEHIPEKHMPRIYHRKDYHENFIDGLFTRALMIDDLFS